VSALDSEEVVFAGAGDSAATNTAADLLRIYRARLSHCEKRGIKAHGIQELMDFLIHCKPDSIFEVQPFLGAGSSITAFWDAAGQLIGCITILGRDPESGRRAFELATGKP